MVNRYVEIPTGHILPQHLAEDYFRKLRQPIGIDLFAGVGEISCGAITAGFEVIATVDNWLAAAMSICTILELILGNFLYGVRKVLYGVAKIGKNLMGYAFRSENPQSFMEAKN